MHTKEEKLAAFGRLLDVLDTLRVKCPWDKKQTNESLRPNTIEEVYELCDALMKDDKKNICKELGDVFMHVCFYALIGSETGDFDIADVCNVEADKLIFRHPHVYGNVKADTVDKVLENWEQIKLKEKDGNKRVLSGVPAALPSLIKAYRIQDKARNVGFDWQDKGDVWGKVREELAELEAELRKEDNEASEKELGDFLFSVINAARLYHLNPDTALEHTNQKFIRRFNYIEDHSIKAGKPLTEMSLAEMDELWNEAKKRSKQTIKLYKTMNKLCWIFLLCCLITVGCDNKKATTVVADNISDNTEVDTTVYGKCGEGTAMHTLELITDKGDTMVYTLEGVDTCSDVQGGLFVGDRLTVIAGQKCDEGVFAKK